MHCLHAHSFSSTILPAGSVIQRQQCEMRLQAKSCKRLQHQQPLQQQQQPRQLVISCAFGSNSSGSSTGRGNGNRDSQQSSSNSSSNVQQSQIDLERLRQQGGYSYPPPSSRSSSSPQQQQQPWSWGQQQQQQQRQQQQPQQYPSPPYAASPPQTETGSGRGGSGNGGSNNNNDGGGLSGYTKALIAAAFVTGLGAGVYFDAEINLSPNQVASTEIIDRRTPNAEVCMAYGYSAMVFDQRVFVTYNPFNLYVTQPEVKPGCILRRSNVSVLERDNLVTGKQVESCKKRMNTFGFVGDLSADPEVSCVYHSEEAENQYLLNPDKALQLGEGPPPRAPALAAGGDKP